MYKLVLIDGICIFIDGICIFIDCICILQRAELTDFERFKLMKAKQAVS